MRCITSIIICIRAAVAGNHRGCPSHCSLREWHLWACTVYSLCDCIQHSWYHATVHRWNSCFSRWTPGLFSHEEEGAICYMPGMKHILPTNSGFLIVSKRRAKWKNAHVESKQQLWVSCKEQLRRRELPIMGWDGGGKCPASDSLGSKAVPWYLTDIRSRCQLMRSRKLRRVCTKHIWGKMEVEWVGAEEERTGMKIQVDRGVHEGGGLSSDHPVDCLTRTL